MNAREFEVSYLRLCAQVSASSSQGFDLATTKTEIPTALNFALRTSGLARINQQHNRLLDPASYESEDGVVPFAEENQGVAYWGFRGGEEDPLILRRDLGDESYGPWVPDGRTMTTFLMSFVYWNAANGSADVTLFGELLARDEARIRSYPSVWADPDFDVRQFAIDTFFIVTRDGDFYAFGRDRAGAANAAVAMGASWSDIEERRGS